MSNNEPQPVDDAQRRLLIAVGGLLLAGVCLLGSSAVTGADRLPPFVWFDVEVVSLLCSLPLGVVLGCRIALAVPRIAGLTAGIALLASFPLLVTSGLLADWFAGLPQAAWPLAVSRLLLSLAACTGGTLFVATMVLLPDDSQRTGVFVPLLLLAAAGGVSETYVKARCRREQTRMQQFAHNRRIVDALEIAQSLAVLRPNGTVPIGPAAKTESIADFVARLQAEVARLEATLSRLSGQPGINARLRRAGCLSQLGRRDEAVRELQPVVDAGDTYHQREACLLLGTINEQARALRDRIVMASQGLSDRCQLRTRAEPGRDVRGAAGNRLFVSEAGELSRRAIGLRIAAGTEPDCGQSFPVGAVL